MNRIFTYFIAISTLLLNSCSNSKSSEFDEVKGHLVVNWDVKKNYFVTGVGDVLYYDSVRFEGETVEHYPNGQRKVVKFYSCGVLSEMQEYYENDSVSHSVSFHPLSHVSTDEVPWCDYPWDDYGMREYHTEYSPNGLVLKNYMIYKNKLNGYYLAYHENGNLKKICEYKDGRVINNLYEFYSNGDIYKTQWFKKYDWFSGSSKIYYLDGGNWVFCNETPRNGKYYYSISQEDYIALNDKIKDEVSILEQDLKMRFPY